MKKLGVALIAALVVTVAFSGCITVGSSPIGFDDDELVAPAIFNATVDPVAMPSPMTAINPPNDMKLSWIITEDIYAGYGRGSFGLYLNNTNSAGRLYIYSFGLELGQRAVHLPQLQCIRPQRRERISRSAHVRGAVRPRRALLQARGESSGL